MADFAQTMYTIQLDAHFDAANTRHVTVFSHDGDALARGAGPNAMALCDLGGAAVRGTSGAVMVFENPGGAVVRN